MVILGLGSNLGNREDNLRQCISLLHQHIDIKKISSHHEFPALLPEGAPESWNTPFLNMVVSGITTLAPDALLHTCKAIETELGRAADHAFWSPRTIDIDILDYEGKTQESPTLTLPHPAMHLRDFVLIPLVEIAPDWQHPTLHKIAATLLQELRSA